MSKEEIQEQVPQIPISEIRPYKAPDEVLMYPAAAGIKQVGVFNPTIIRPAQRAATKW